MSPTPHGRAEALLQDRLARAPDFVIPSLESLSVCEQNVPPWWIENGNLLLAAQPELRLNVVPHPHLPPPTNSIVILGENIVLPATFILWGDAPTVLVDNGTHLPSCNLACGGGSTIALGQSISSAGGANINARNGGLICVGPNGLWSNRVYIATDDMHAILDKETGERVNPFGGVITIGEHVWIGLEAMITGGAAIGRDCVIGSRALVRHPIPENAIAVGLPARVTREGITWSADDIPPLARG